MRKIKIFDTTLRDGEQTPGVALAIESKVAIARQLDKLGVNIIEAGFPVVSKGEMEAVRAVAMDGLKAEVCGLARTTKQDIDAALRCNVESVHIFIATSPIHMKHKLHMTKEQVIDNIAKSIRYAKSQGLNVEFSAEDATRTELQFLKKAYRTAVQAGADRINVPDTVGVMIPQRMRSLIKKLSKTVKVPISVHCHNDFGMAVANSLAAYEGGASQIHVTINGLGERAGNASLEEVVTALYSLYNQKTSINTQLIYDTSRLVSKLTGVMIPITKPIVGENAFAHESGIHTKGIVEAATTYEPINPEMIGRKSLLIPGKHAGTVGLKRQIGELGYHPSDEQMKIIFSKVKEFGDTGKLLTTTDLLSIVSSVCGRLNEGQKRVGLKDLTVVTGSNVIPTASVKLILDGKEYISSETGVGPVDAAIKAIQKVTNKIVNVQLKEYRIEALTGGSDAVGEVIVKVEDSEGKIASARAAVPDVVIASVQALINGLNMLLSLGKNRQTDK